MSAKKSRARKSLILRVRQMRRRIERQELMIPRPPQQRPKIIPRRTFPHGTAATLVIGKVRPDTTDTPPEAA